MSREIGPSGLPLDRLVRRAGPSRGAHGRRRKPGPALLPAWMVAVAAIAAIVLIRP